MSTDAQQIEDLDVLVPTPKHVKFKGSIYTLPGDMPLEIHLRIQAAQQRAAFGTEPDDGEKALLDILEAIIDLFTLQTPENERKEIAERLRGQLMKLGMGTISRMATHIYRSRDGEDDEREPGEEPAPVDADRVVADPQ